jgi:hypothetical protein
MNRYVAWEAFGADVNSDAIRRELQVGIPLVEPRHISRGALIRTQGKGRAKRVTKEEIGGIVGSSELGIPADQTSTLLCSWLVEQTRSGLT